GTVWVGANAPDWRGPRRPGLGLAGSFQTRTIFDSFSAEGNVPLAVQATERHSFRFWQPAERIARLRRPARRLIADVGLSRLGNVIASRMSHGQHRQLELGMALATHPIMLLLGEPMAGVGVRG